MILDMNIKLEGIDEEFLEELDDLIEDTRVEYFIINPQSHDDVQKTQELCSQYQRFKYSLPVEFQSNMDDNCVALRVTDPTDLLEISDKALVVASEDLDDGFIATLNDKGLKGVVLDAKESDNRLENFAYAISHESLQQWSKKGITDTDYNKIALQSDYPTYSYDDLLDGLLKDISDLTFRAEQTIAAGGTRTVLKSFALL